jgi:hypothetical protein
MQETGVIIFKTGQGIVLTDGRTNPTCQLSRIFPGKCAKNASKECELTKTAGDIIRDKVMHGV